jgi:hypothetical protein
LADLESRIAELEFCKESSVIRSDAITANEAPIPNAQPGPIADQQAAGRHCDSDDFIVKDESGAQVTR